MLLTLLINGIITLLNWFLSLFPFPDGSEMLSALTPYLDRFLGYLPDAIHVLQFFVGAPAWGIIVGFFRFYYAVIQVAITIAAVGVLTQFVIPFIKNKLPGAG